MIFRPRRIRERGSAALETALWIPIIFTLFMGTVELGRITYTYYTLQKTLSSIALIASTQSNINFCNPGDPALHEIKRMAIQSTGEAGTASTGHIMGLISNLTPEMIEIRAERYSRETGTISGCTCSATPDGCDASVGASGPDYLAVSIPDGYPMQLRIPGVSIEPIPLRPHILVPYTAQ